MSRRRRLTGAAPVRRWTTWLAGAVRRALPAGAVRRALPAGAVLLALPAGAAAAQVDVFVEVNPSTIQAGFQVGIRASCGEDLNPASVRSGAFGELTLTPHQGSGLMVGSATVPSSTKPGQYRVDLRCANGATASADLFVLDMAQPTRGPKTGGGGTGGGTDPGQAGPVLLAGAGAALMAGAGLLLAYRRRTG